MKKRIFVLAACVLLFIACNKSKGTYKPKSIGLYSEVVVVNSDSTLFRNVLNPAFMDSTVFGRQFKGLLFPPSFQLVTKNISQEKFNKQRGVRSVILFEKGNPGIEFKKDVYAAPQSLVIIKGNTSQDYVNTIRFYADSLIESFIDADERYVIKSKKSKDIKIKPLLDSLNLKMVLPNSFTLIKKQKDFTWYREDIIEDIINVMFYSTAAPEKLTTDHLVQIRDIYNKRHVESSKAGDYSLTDSIFKPIIDTISTSKDQSIYELRGNWNMAIDMMGGPFVTRVIHDKKENKLHYADSFIYAPYVNYVDKNRRKKRIYLVQLSALLSTFNQK